MIRYIVVGLGMAFCLISMPTTSFAQLVVNIDQGSAKSLPIALPVFETNTAKGKKIASDIIKVIQGDLENSGLFSVVNPKAYIQKQNNGAATIPHYPSWRKIDAQVLLFGELDVKGNAVIVRFRLWDVFAEKEFAAGEFPPIPERSWRRIGHQIADAIYARLTGEGGYFDTRIMYIKEEGDPRRPRKLLAMMEQDGANHLILKERKGMILTPRFNPVNSREFIYMAYHNRRPSVYVYNWQTGKERMLGQFDGMSFAPRFSPDGTKAIMSASHKGNAEIYELDLKNGKKRRLTRDGAIDTSPSYSPDGKFIAFNSDRSGSQQLYVMRRDGGGVKRISHAKGSYATPVWSPRGDWIAFTKMSGGLFHIGVMRPDGKDERLLTESYLDEGPTWAPNGRVILFTRETRGSKTSRGRSGLYSVDLTGRNLRKIPTPGEASDPAWSPLLTVR